MDRIDEMETLAALDEAAAEIERGEGVNAQEMMAHLRKEFGMPRRGRPSDAGASGLPISHMLLVHQQVQLPQGLPFGIRIPNETTRAALDDAAARRNLEDCTSSDALFTDPGI